MKIQLTGQGIKIGDKFEVLLCASLFYFRLPRHVWEDRIEKLKNAGYNCVDVYFPWNYHENKDGSFDFSGEKDVEYFLQLLSKSGLYVVVRPGPYICSEWTGGAIPARVLESGNLIRQNDRYFIDQTKKWYQAILPIIAKYEYGKGGTVILCQLENELDFFDCPDPTTYVIQLKNLALSCGVTVPLFCCCGQYHAEKASGFVDGINITVNCYPSSDDNTFDKELRMYADYFAGQNKPLLVSETNRDHFLLRREFSCGSKLLGAYNQVAGNDFEYYQSINNWGSPLSFLASVYDFESMIDTAGNYRREAIEGVFFSAFLRSMGENLAKSEKSNPIMPNSSQFKTTEEGLSVLKLADDGYAICTPNFDDKDGEMQLSINGKELTSFVKGKTAPFSLFDVKLNVNGKAVTITRSNSEVVDVKENKIVFRSNKNAFIGIDCGVGEKIFNSTCEQDGIQVIVLNDEQALEYLTGGKVSAYDNYIEEDFTEIYQGTNLPNQKQMTEIVETTFRGLGIDNGVAEYSVKIEPNKKLFIEQPCDVITLFSNEQFKYCMVADGRDIICGGNENGEYLVRVEKWGHSNFDDPQTPSLRIASNKGVKAFGMVLSEHVINKCDFTLLDDFGKQTVNLDSKFRVRQNVNSWNTTRKPVNCAYTFDVARITDRLIIKTAENVEIAVYVDGALKGMCDFGTFELTPYVDVDKRAKVTLVYHKLVWTQNCGQVKVLDVKNVYPYKVETLSNDEMSGFNCNAKLLATLPMYISGGEKKSFSIDVSNCKKEGFIRFYGKGVRLTCVADNRVVGRLIVGWEESVKVVGGNPFDLYICPDDYNDKKISIYAEGCDNDSQITAIEYVF